MNGQGMIARVRTTELMSPVLHHLFGTGDDTATETDPWPISRPIFLRGEMTRVSEIDPAAISSRTSYEQGKAGTLRSISHVSPVHSGITDRDDYHAVNETSFRSIRNLIMLRGVGVLETAMDRILQHNLLTERDAAVPESVERNISLCIILAGRDSVWYETDSTHILPRNIFESRIDNLNEYEGFRNPRLNSYESVRRSESVRHNDSRKAWIGGDLLAEIDSRYASYPHISHGTTLFLRPKELVFRGNSCNRLSTKGVSLTHTVRSVTIYEMVA